MGNGIIGKTGGYGTPVLRSDVERESSLAQAVTCTARQASFHEAIDMGMSPRAALTKCVPSKTKDITKERMQICVDAGITVPELAGVFSTSTANIYLRLSNLQIKIGKRGIGKAHAAPIEAKAEKAEQQPAELEPMLGEALEPELINFGDMIRFVKKKSSTVDNVVIVTSTKGIQISLVVAKLFVMGKPVEVFMSKDFNTIVLRESDSGFPLCDIKKLAGENAVLC